MRNWKRDALLLVLVPSLALVAGLVVAQSKREPPSVVAARKKLQTRISVEFNNTRLEECLEEIKSQVEGLNFYRGVGVSNNLTITYVGKDQTVDQVLRGMFKGKGLGYVIHRATKPGDRYDGWIQIVQAMFSATWTRPWKKNRRNRKNRRSPPTNPAQNPHPKPNRDRLAPSLRLAPAEGSSAQNGKRPFRNPQTLLPPKDLFRGRSMPPTSHYLVITQPLPAPAPNFQHLHSISTK
jgi:hypothetical protein